jgi:hypothetical protein
VIRVIVEPETNIVWSNPVLPPDVASNQESRLPSSNAKCTQCWNGCIRVRTGFEGGEGVGERLAHGSRFQALLRRRGASTAGALRSRSEPECPNRLDSMLQL